MIYNDVVQFDQVQNPFFIPFCCSEFLRSTPASLLSSTLVAWGVADKLVEAAVRQ